MLRVPIYVTKCVLFNENPENHKICQIAIRRSEGCFRLHGQPWRPTQLQLQVWHSDALHGHSGRILSGQPSRVLSVRFDPDVAPQPFALRYSAPEPVDLVDELINKARISVHKGSDGQTDGFRLSGIRRTSLWKRMGIKNGDIVHSVNGQTLNDANKAAEAYGSLQGVSNFTFEVTRRNERQIFEYEVQ